MAQPIHIESDNRNFDCMLRRLVRGNEIRTLKCDAVSKILLHCMLQNYIKYKTFDPSGNTARGVYSRITITLMMEVRYLVSLSRPYFVSV